MSLEHVLKLSFILRWENTSNKVKVLCSVDKVTELKKTSARF